MKLIVGLGNPGEKYKDNRHNIGFMVIDALAQSMNFKEWKFDKKFEAEVSDRLPIGILVKPQGFMNQSGITVQKLFSFYKLGVGDIWVIHDDLDIKLGEYKIQKEHGPKLHGGINSIEKHLGSEFFNRVRIGVDNRDPENRTQGEEYVLQDFTTKEKEILAEVIKKVVDDLCKRLVM